MKFKKFFVIIRPREGGMACPEGYIKSPKAESLVMAGKKGAEKGTLSSSFSGVSQVG